MIELVKLARPAIRLSRPSPIDPTTATRDALEIQRITMYFHSPAMRAQLLIIVAGRQSLVVDVIMWTVWPAPLYSYIIQIGDRVVTIVVLEIAARTVTRVDVVGVGLLSDHVTSTTCKFTLHRLAKFIRIFPCPGWAAVVISVAPSPVKIFNMCH